VSSKQQFRPSVHAAPFDGMEFDDMIMLLLVLVYEMCTLHAWLFPAGLLSANCALARVSVRVYIFLPGFSTKSSKN
jgi:hypothetical protein